MKRVLLVAYDFPPRGAAGVFRVAKFARYLPEWGWEPVVVTVADAGPHPDPALLDELPPGIEILRVGAATRARPSAAAVPVAPGQGWRSSPRRWIVPDPQIVWIPGAVRAAAERLKRGGIAAIMTSAPPFSTSLVGYILKRMHPHLPWLMDMRDLWSEGPDQRLLLPYKLNRSLEQLCLRTADHTTVVTEGVRQLMIRRLAADPERMTTLTNGFDPNDLPSPLLGRERAANGAGPRPLLLQYVGTISGMRTPASEGFFTALRRLQREGVDSGQLRVQLIGSFAPPVHRWAEELVAAGIVEILPFLPHSEAIRGMAGADALLLILTDDWEGRVVHTSKLFEYLAVGRPILAVAPPGEVTRLLEQEQAGVWASPGDVDAIVAALRGLLATHANGESIVAEATGGRFRRFERRELTGQLARLLDRLIAGTFSEASRMEGRT